MAINAGIIGLPNVGKSTIFSALTSVNAVADNYPFCTIDPNVGTVEVPDARLDKIARIFNPQNTIPTFFEFLDIAGLVKGASQGEGLGNRFLSHIRETGILAHVVRCFEDDNIIHVHGNIDPMRDIEIINTELALADLETVSKRLAQTISDQRANNPALKRKLQFTEALLLRIKDTLDDGKPVRSLHLTKEELECIYDLHLISVKPIVYVCNVKEQDITEGNVYTKKVQALAEAENCESMILCGQLESEIAQLPKEERTLFLKDAGLMYSALDTLIRSTYHSLGLRTFFTAGEKEVRAWTFKDKSLAPEVAGIIHSDFQKGFIKAEVFNCEDLFTYGSEGALKSAGKLRTEGKEYEVKDGDVIFFRFNV